MHRERPLESLSWEAGPEPQGRHPAPPPVWTVHMGRRSRLSPHLRPPRRRKASSPRRALVPTNENLINTELCLNVKKRNRTYLRRPNKQAFVSSVLGLDTLGEPLYRTYVGNHKTHRSLVVCHRLKRKTMSVRHYVIGPSACSFRGHCRGEYTTNNLRLESSRILCTGEREPSVYKSYGALRCNMDGLQCTSEEHPAN